MTDLPGSPPVRWLSALAEARSGERVANVVWFGDSISELDPAYVPLPWFVGRVLSGWTEHVQYRNAGAEYTAAMSTTGTHSADDDAGFGGRSVDLEPGESCSIIVVGTGISLLWTRRPGGGLLDVTWGADRLGTLNTDGPLAHSERTVFRRSEGNPTEAVKVTAREAPATLEGMYLHARNLDHGVRMWPAVRSGSTTQDFIDRPGWGLDALETLDPDLVVIATGTNVVTSYEVELAALIDAVRARSRCDVAVWVPYVNSSFTLAKAAAGRAVAEEKRCMVVDAAAALGQPSTVDGAHPDAVGTAVAGAHAAAVLSGDPVLTATLIAGQLAASIGLGQEWRPGGGTIAIEDPFGSTVLSGRGRVGESGQQWAMLLDGLAHGLFGLPGATVALGPGGDRPVDTHISRAGVGHVSLNAGAGRLDLARLQLNSGEQPGAEAGGATLYARRRDGATELAVRLPNGNDHVVAPAPRSGYRAPVPCALTPAHRPCAEGVTLVSGRVIWVPFPVLELPTVATHVWVEVAAPQPGWSAVAAIVTTRADGRPGDVVQTTGPGAIDLSVAGMAGAALQTRAPVTAGEPWWVAILASGSDGSPRVGAAAALEGWPSAQIGAAPVVPSPGSATGGLALDGQPDVPAGPGVGLVDVVGSLPVLHVSLEAP